MANKNSFEINRGITLSSEKPNLTKKYTQKSFVAQPTSTFQSKNNDFKGTLGAAYVTPKAYGFCYKQLNETKNLFINTKNCTPTTKFECKIRNQYQDRNKAKISKNINLKLRAVIAIEANKKAS